MSNKFNRRAFLKGLSAGAAYTALGGLGQAMLMRQAQAAAPAFGDYKALVCVFLYGGNDSSNMLIPIGADANRGYSQYSSLRGIFAVSNTDLDLATIAGGVDLNNGNLPLGAGNPYYDATEPMANAYVKGLYPLTSKGIELGVNGVMPELAQLIADNKASVLANMGTLVEPVTRAEILAGTANLPLFLFAHNHQQRILQTGQADNLDDIGWAGRIADNWSGVNNSSPLGLNISYGGNDRMLIGNSTRPLVLGTGNPPSRPDMLVSGGNGQQDRRALYKALAGEQNSSSSGNVSFGASNTFNTSDPFHSLYNSMLLKSLSTFDMLKAAWDARTMNYTSTGPYGEALWDVPTQAHTGFNQNLSGRLIKQFEAVAKMIHMGASSDLGTPYNRQVFFLSFGGFDTHASQMEQHPKLLREVSLAIWKFQKALEELGHENKVTTFTMSDFGRTLSRNGDGTDHAWGAHHFVIGGDGLGASGNLNGGTMLGTLPDLRLSGDDDYSDKGRTIPTTAQDQLNATLCSWLGVSDDLMPTILPNLPNFQSGGTIDTAYLNSLFV